MAKGEKIKNQKFEVGKRFQWALPEDTIRIKKSKNKSEAKKAWRKDFFSKKTSTDFGYIVKDPIPTLTRVAGTIYRLIRK